MEQVFSFFLFDKGYTRGVYEFIYQLSSAIDGILDISIRTAEAAQRDPPKSEPAF